MLPRFALYPVATFGPFSRLHSCLTITCVETVRIATVEVLVQSRPIPALLALGFLAWLPFRFARSEIHLDTGKPVVIPRRTLNRLELFPAMLLMAISALLIPALASAQAPAQTAQQEQEKCVLTGRVTNALTGEPVKKADVHLEYANRKKSMSGPRGYGGLADADGRFRFEGVEPGEYSLTAERPGYLHSSYGSKAPNQAGTNLVLTPGQQMADLSIALSPQGVISSRVVDGDGDPVQSTVYCSR